MMTKKSLARSTALTAALMLSLTGVAAGQDADTVETQIEQRWAADARLKACTSCDIDVEFTGGVARLTGDVPTEALKARAERLARIAGVTRVDNQLTIEPDAGVTAADKTRSGLNKAADKTGDALDKAGERTGQTLSKTGEVITDAWITTKVKARFMGDDPLKGSSIDVDTKDHVVTLTGTVTSEAARSHALAKAREIEGVKRVVDKLSVAPKT